MGCTSLMAQTDDPFGEVKKNKYANNMTITGYVRMGGKVLGKETVVAVYCGKELRGKDSPMDDGSYTDILYLGIHGDTKGQPLHFKVFTDGRVIEVDQNLTYTNNAVIGMPENPYYIDLPVPIVTTFANEGWATACVPYDAAVPKGVTVWNVTGIERGELVMEKLGTSTDEETKILPANTPVLLEAPGAGSQDSSQPVEWLARVVNSETLAQHSSLFTLYSSLLKGTTVPTAVAANSVLTLGHSDEGNSEIGFWRYTGTEIPAYRAYIADFPAGARGYPLFGDPGTTTGIYDIPVFDSTFDSENSGQIVNRKLYSLSGRRQSQRDARMFNVQITKGKKILMK